MNISEVSGNPVNDCGGSEFGCRTANAEAGILPCHGCIERNKKHDHEREMDARTNYCRMFRHDWRVIEEDGEDEGEDKVCVLYCANHCSASGNYVVVPRT